MKASASFQRELQQGNNRNGTLDAYDEYLETGRVYKAGILGLLKSYLDSQGFCVWADIGSGNSIALRQAKLRLEEMGVDLSLVKTYSVDILPVDQKEIESLIKKYPSHYESNLLNADYSPLILPEDCAEVVFPEKPDFITFIWSLPWIERPIKAISNLVSQLNSGGIIGAFPTKHLLDTDRTSEGIEHVLFYRLGKPNNPYAAFNDDLPFFKNLIRDKYYTLLARNAE